MGPLRKCPQLDMNNLCLRMRRFRAEVDENLTVQGDMNNQKQHGRDHHPYCFSLWMAGGGIKGGTTYGQSDEFGYNVAENGVHVHDLQATILHLLGINHEQLTYRFQGREFRLTDVHGQVVQPILA